jgi:hypothetical protein
MQSTLNLTTLGKLAGEIKTPVHVLKRIIARLGITPVQTLNGVPYFSQTDIERIADSVRGGAQPSHIHRPSVH